MPALDHCARCKKPKRAKHVEPFCAECEALMKVDSLRLVTSELCSDCQRRGRVPGSSRCNICLDTARRLDSAARKVRFRTRGPGRL